jgi:L-amino acid N-acyltransferase YncA
MAGKDTTSRTPYPKQVKLADGTEVTLRRAEPKDQDKMLKFASQIPERDLLFLRSDITDPAVVKEWAEELKRGRTATILAEVNGEIAAYASIHMDQARWTRRVGEIRINAATRWRGRGLGRRLVSEIFELGTSLGLGKLAAMMTPDQTAARSAFERLGFRIEAILTDWVEDRGGRTRDVLVMTYDLAGLTDVVVANR